MRLVRDPIFMTQSASATTTIGTPRDAGVVVRAIWELSKPGVTRLVLVTTALGVIAAPGSFTWVDMLATVFGTGLVVAGANALNMFIERESDRKMRRTLGRPLPTGRLTPDEALAFGVLVSIFGLFTLAEFVSTAAVVLATVALLSYVLVYTPLKRISSVALYVGAVPGALPPAIGYAALTGTVDGAGLSLFLILFVWQLPHFLAITLFRADEYARAGLQVLPNERGVRFTRWVALLLSVFLLVVTLLPVWTLQAGATYAVIAAVSGTLYVAWSARGLLPDADEKWARSFFFASMPHLVLVMAALVVAIH